MENNENLVVEQIAENTEQTAEQTTPKTYTQEEVDAIVSKRLGRKEAKIRKEYDRKYGELTEVLKAGTGKEDVEDMTNTFKQFYEKKGIKLPQQPAYSEKDIDTLARTDAEEIISGGYEEIVEEVDRLSNMGLSNMSARDKAMFKVLAEKRASIERGKELAGIGVTEDVYDSQEFKDFASKFNANTPIRDIYDIYAKTQPKKEIKPMGSMKNTATEDSGVKEYYSPEEARKFSQKEINSNPALVKAIENSMKRWK